jgi:transaldolase
VEYANPAVEHQMGPVVGAIVATFKQLGATTHVMPASVVTPEEAIALSTLGVDDLTLPPKVLEGLAARPVTQADLDAGVSVPKLASATDFPDFLANDGVTLDASIKSDISVQERLEYAVK